MRQVLSIFSIILFCGSAHTADPYKCVSNNQCTKAYHGCGTYESVNKKYKARVEKRKHLRDKQAFCDAPTQKAKDFYYKSISICEKHSCKLVLPSKETN